MRFRGLCLRVRSPFRVRSILPGLVFGLLAVVSCPFGVAAQCDDDKIRKASAGASGYQKIDLPEYSGPGLALCEGIYGKNVSGQVLTFLGLTETEPMWFETYDPVQIGWLAPEDVVHVRAQSWAEQAFQMDARVADATVLEWAVDLLRSESIPLRQVGLLGWVEAGDDRLYVPLRFSQDPEPEPGDEYVFQFLPNARLSEVAVTIAPVGAVGERPTGSYVRNEDPLTLRNFPMARAFDIYVPRSDLPSPGIYFIEILATQEGASTPERMARWFHHGG